MAEEIREQYVPDAEALIRDGVVELYTEKNKQYNGAYAAIVQSGVNTLKDQNNGELPEIKDLLSNVDPFNYDKAVSEAQIALKVGYEAFEEKSARIDEQMEALKVEKAAETTEFVGAAKELAGIER